MFQTGNPPDVPRYVFRASRIEKIAVVLEHRLFPDTPQTLEVQGRELVSGTSKVFIVSHLIGGFGPGYQWGGGFNFPVPGCWELSVDAPQNSGSIILEVSAPEEP